MNRIDRLRERMVRVAHGRHRALVPDHWTTHDQGGGLAGRKGLALKMLIENMPVAIDDDELIVGWRTMSGARNKDVTSIEDPSRDVWIHGYPRYLTGEEREEAKAGPWWNGEASASGHAVGGYGKILQHGLGGIRRLALERLEAEADPERRDFLKGVAIAYEAAGILAKRYAGLAAQMAQTAAEPRKAELQRIEAVCRNIAEKPPLSLHEALQLYWFAHIVLLMENYALISFGRFDQTIVPFWDVCPPDEAMELLQCFFIKLNDQADIVARISYTDNLTIAGLKPDGADASNPVSYACIDAVQALNLEQPMLAIRLHKSSPAKLLRRVSQLAARRGGGQMSLYNDDAFVPALEGVGFASEYARNYSLDACQNVGIDGCSQFFIAGMIEMTPLLLETLEHVDDASSYEAFLDDYRSRIARVIQTFADDHERSRFRRRFSPLLFLSGSLDDCIEKAKCMTDEGCRFYDKGMVVQSPVNAVNGLAAIKRVVYEENAATLAEVREACRNNFEGAEPLRRKLLAAPKWGNDDDRVDGPGRELLEFACREILKHRIDDEARYLSGIHQAHHVANGANIPATPDGRRAGEPIPATISPTNGTEKHGPTAIIRSATKIDPMLCPWNFGLQLTFSPSTLDGDEGMEKFESLIRTYIAMRGPQLQFNVVDPETLRQAQLQPERYSDLIVRVWGFCARFVDLTKDYQDDLIRRTAHTI